MSDTPDTVITGIQTAQILWHVTVLLDNKPYLLHVHADHESALTDYTEQYTDCLANGYVVVLDGTTAYGMFAILAANVGGYDTYATVALTQYLG